MSDRRLRELERRAAAGDVEAGAEWLHARVRTGTLDEERLAVAAWLGDPAACRVSGGTLAPETAPDAAGVAGGLARWGREPARDPTRAALEDPGWRDQLLPRAALAIACAACPRAWASGDGRAALDAAQAWLDAPGLVAAQVADAAALAPNLGSLRGLSPVEALARLAALHCAPGPARAIPTVLLVRAALLVDLATAKRAFETPGGLAAHMAAAAAARLGDDAVREALRAGLVAWVLG